MAITLTQFIQLYHNITSSSYKFNTLNALHTLFDEKFEPLSKHSLSYLQNFSKQKQLFEVFQNQTNQFDSYKVVIAKNYLLKTIISEYLETNQYIIELNRMIIKILNDKHKFSSEILTKQNNKRRLSLPQETSKRQSMERKNDTAMGISQSPDKSNKTSNLKLNDNRNGSPFDKPVVKKQNQFMIYLPGLKINKNQGFDTTIQTEESVSQPCKMYKVNVVNDKNNNSSMGYFTKFDINIQSHSYNQKNYSTIEVRQDERISRFSNQKITEQKGNEKVKKTISNEKKNIKSQEKKQFSKEKIDSKQEQNISNQQKNQGIEKKKNDISENQSRLEKQRKQRSLEKQQEEMKETERLLKLQKQLNLEKQKYESNQRLISAEKDLEKKNEEKKENILRNQQRNQHDKEIDEKKGKQIKNNPENSRLNQTYNKDLTKTNELTSIQSQNKNTKINQTQIETEESNQKVIKKEKENITRKNQMNQELQNEKKLDYQFDLNNFEKIKINTENELQEQKQKEIEKEKQIEIEKEKGNQKNKENEDKEAIEKYKREEQKIEEGEKQKKLEKEKQEEKVNQDEIVEKNDEVRDQNILRQLLGSNTNENEGNNSIKCLQSAESNLDCSQQIQQEQTGQSVTNVQKNSLMIIKEEQEFPKQKNKFIKRQDSIKQKQIDRSLKKISKLKTPSNKYKNESYLNIPNNGTQSPKQFKSQQSINDNELKTITLFYPLTTQSFSGIADINEKLNDSEEKAIQQQVSKSFSERKKDSVPKVDDNQLSQVQNKPRVNSKIKAMQDKIGFIFGVRKPPEKKNKEFSESSSEFETLQLDRSTVMRKRKITINNFNQDDEEEEQPRARQKSIFLEIK